MLLILIKKNVRTLLYVFVWPKMEKKSNNKGESMHIRISEIGQPLVLIYKRFLFSLK